MADFIPISRKRIYLVLFALGVAGLPVAHGASETEFPGNDAEEQFNAGQRELPRMHRKSLVETAANTELAKAKIAALKEKIESQKASISALTAEIEGKEQELFAKMGGNVAAGGTAKAGSKINLPARFVADVTPHIVIIEGDKGSGTGFLCRSGDQVWLYTAAHVLSGNHTVTVRDGAGRVYRDFEFFECAEGVDLVCLKPKDTELTGLDLATPDDAPKMGEIIVAIGNSLGAGSLSGESGHIMSVQDDMWEWRRMPISRYVKEWDYIDNMSRENSLAWASIYLMHTGPDEETDPEMVKLAESILARDRNHILVQRVDEWLKRYRAAGTVRHNSLIEEGNKIIARNLEEIRIKDDAPTPDDFSWFHRRIYESEVDWRKKLTGANQ